MNLHKDLEAFEELSRIVSQWRHIPIEAVKRDYLIVFLLKKLSESDFVDKVVFKGGTSLSKCYPGTIERFSEDIDLTFLGTELSDKKKDKVIKQIETIMWSELPFEKINDERRKVSKSSYVWMEEIGKAYRIKLEIGSTIRPEPSKMMNLKTYIQEYLEEGELFDVVNEYELTEIPIRVLDITRTFLDKVLAVKRHAYNEDLLRKVRHIYDVVKLFENTEVKKFLHQPCELKDLLNLTKSTDGYYINKRKNHKEDYRPDSAFEFEKWRSSFDTKEIREIYEGLHIDLLYTNERQKFDKAVEVFEQIDRILKSVEMT